MLPFVGHADRPRGRVGVISGLVAAHLLAGVILGSCVRLFDYNPQEITSLLFVGLAFAQAGLIGFWAAFGPARWWVRLVGASICTTLLAGGFSCGIDEHDWQTYHIFGFSTFAVAAGLAVLRYFRFRLVLGPRDSSPALPLQFSIRHLLVLTLLTAAITTLALNLKIGLSGFRLPLLVTLMSLPFAAVAIVAPWAVLGQARLPIRGVVMLVVTAVAGTALFYLLREIELTWMLLAETGMLAFTLLVVRVCGYRLSRRRESPEDYAEADRQ